MEALKGHRQRGPICLSRNGNICEIIICPFVHFFDLLMKLRKFVEDWISFVKYKNVSFFFYPGFVNPKSVMFTEAKGVRALRGYFAPPPTPMRSKNKSCSSQVSSY